MEENLNKKKQRRSDIYMKRENTVITALDALKKELKKEPISPRRINALSNTVKALLETIPHL